MSIDLEEDPGWQLSWKEALLVLVPYYGVRRTKDSPKEPLQMLRTVFVSFCAAVVLVGVVVIVLGDLNPDEPDQPGLAVAATAGVGLVSLVLQRILSKPLDCTSTARLAETYRSRFFVRLAFAETCALAGFVVFVQIGPGWVYAVGMAFSAIGFAYAAPTAAHLRADQDELSANGCMCSLVAALRRR